MPDQNSPFQELEQKLSALREKIILHQSLGAAITAGFESLLSDLGSLKQGFGSTSSEFESTIPKFGAISSGFDAIKELNGVTSSEFEPTTQKFGAISSGFDAIKNLNGSTNSGFESTTQKFESTNSGDGSLPSDSLVKSIIRAAAENKIYFGQPSIPVRLAKIVQALLEKKSLSVEEMRELTGASRNSINRDTRILKQMNWIQFKGGRRNGRFVTHPLAPALSAWGDL